MAPARVARTLRRIAAEVIERNRGSERLLIFGIERRGVAVAEWLADAIREVAGRPVAVQPLDVSPFRDDRTDGDVTSVAGPDVTGHDVLIVDDVLFTGRTARAAIEAVLHLGRPARIQLAVLIDRGHRELPVQPDYVGRVVPTSYRERVTVEVDSEPAVYLEE
jgi:pyrimidine operon attenuation protein/uracil phosphoribosyltransferase